MTFRPQPAATAATLYSSGDEDEPHMGVGADVDAGAQTDAAAAAALMAVDPMGHVPLNMFQNVMRRRLRITMNGSPAQLAADPSKSVWRVGSHLTKAFKQNTALRQRDMATDDQLAGNLNRGVVLGLQLLEKQNTYPFDVALRAPGFMMDQVDTDKHSALLVIGAGTSQPLMVNLPIFDPVNKLTPADYFNYAKCSLEDLGNDITFVPKRGNTPGRAIIAVGSMAHQTLKNSLQDEVPEWANDLHTINVENIFMPRGITTVEVSERMGKDILRALEAPVRAAAESMVDFSDLSFQWARADGQDGWINPKGVHGAIASTAMVSKKLNSDIMQRNAQASAEVEIAFLMF